MTFALTFPHIDPVLIAIGPLAIRWYALAYMAGLLLGWQYVKWLARRTPDSLSERDADDFLLWATLGVVLGGRIGYVLFYNLPYYLSDPLAALAIWQGGMSFHGGLLGVVTAIILFARHRRLNILAVGDIIAAAAPIGLLFGRIANFINGELFGRPVAEGEWLPWAMAFPRGGPELRHPSQLYEAALEGLLLVVVLHVAWRCRAVRQRPGRLFGLFLVGYGLARACVELFRQPDSQIGLLIGGTTMGQWLSVPMILVGLWLVLRRHATGEPSRHP